MRCKQQLLAAVLCAFSISGCSSVNFKQLSSQGPEFNFIEYFEGHTRASGWFADRFGNVKRHFCGDFIGEVRGEQFDLDETLYYTDGVIEKRLWSVTITPEGKFKAESEALVGPAIGVQEGSGLRLHYKMNVLLAQNKTMLFKMNDYMFFQPDGSLHNSTEVNKWGFRIGNVSTQYYKHDGSDACMSNEQDVASSKGRFSVAS